MKNATRPRTVQKVDEMTHTQKRVYRVLAAIGFILTIAFGLWWFMPQHIASNFSGYFHFFDFALFIILSYVVWYQIVNEVFFWTTSLFMKRPVYIAPRPGMRVAFLTAFVPGSEPYDVLEKALQAMTAVQYPHDTWILDEGNDDRAKELCKKYGAFHYSRKGIKKYNSTHGPFKAKTKGGNYNSWYDNYGNAYEFVAQVDVDFAPKPDFLLKTLGYFQDPDVAFVGSPQIYGNTGDSWIAKGAAEQAYSFYGTMQKGFYGSDMQLFIGANHVVRVAAHNSIEGYAGHIVEDHLTGMNFYAKKWKSVYVPEILAVGEGPATWDAYFGQQMRWAYGLIDILFNHSPLIFRKMRLKHVINYFLLQQYYFYGLAQVLGIFLLFLYFFFGIQSTAMHLLPLLLLYIPVLVWQQVMFIWLQRFNIDPETEKGWLIRGKLLSWAAWPIYFLALVGVIFRKRLTYKVTPKGQGQHTTTALSHFAPHFFLGAITAADVVAAFSLRHIAVQLLFWAVINSLVMLSFVSVVLLEKGHIFSKTMLRSIRASLPLPYRVKRIELW